MENDTSAMGSDPVEPAEMEMLKKLILADEARTIEAIKDRVDEISTTDYYAKSLPDAIQNSHHHSAKSLACALKQPLVETIELSAATDRQPLSEALLPLIGAALKGGFQTKLQQFKSDRKWRILTGLLAVALVGMVVFSLRNYIYEGRLQKAIISQPGIKFVSSKSLLFRKDVVTILRDPMAIRVDELLAKADVPANWKHIAETSFISLDEPFASRREREALQKSREIRDSYQAEISALYRKIENLSTISFEGADYPTVVTRDFFNRFPIGQTAELKWQGGTSWELLGSAENPWYNRVVSKPGELIKGGGEIDLQNFELHIPRRLSELRSEITELVITYQSAGVRLTPRAHHVRNILIARLENLLALHQELGLPAPEIELHATPVAGLDEKENLSVIRQRLKTEAEAIKASSVGAYLQISTFLDNGPSPNGQGVYVIPK